MRDTASRPNTFVKGIRKRRLLPEEDQAKNDGEILFHSSMRRGGGLMIVGRSTPYRDFRL